jgi:creatinine amidohydrolase
VTTAWPERDWWGLGPAEAEAAAGRDPVVILPLAATEQHGPHLPLSTDCDIGAGILAEALRLLADAADVWTLPAITIGASEEHARLPGTASVSAEQLIREIVDRGSALAASGVRRLVLANSHGGNRSAMEAAALTLRSEHDLLVVKASWFRFERPEGLGLPEGEWRHGLHGGAVETAMMLHLRPDLVHRALIADFPSLGQELEHTLRRLGPEGQASFAWLAADLHPAGVVGDARLATAELGRRLVEHYGRALAEVIRDTRAFPLERLARGDASQERVANHARAVAPRAGSTLDEGAAWALVRALVPGSATRTSPARVSLPQGSGAWLDVRAGGSWVASGKVSAAARDVLDIYLPVRLPADLVMGQLGQSLDGRIATEGGASHFVTGPKDIERLHRLRALVDAVIVGASTVDHDDPRLTVRLVEGTNPVRVVLDPTGRLDRARQVFDQASSPTIVVRRSEGAESGRGTSGAELLVPWSEPEGFDLVALLGHLRARGLRRILVEGGGVTVSRFLERGLLDRLHLTIAPMLIGSGRPSITLEAIASLDAALRPAWRRFTLGEDVLFDLDLRAPRPRT